MGLLDKIFRQDRSGPSSVAPSATQFQDSEDGDNEDKDKGQAEASRTTVHKELVQVTLRETMRRHAVPSDWLEVRMLPVINRTGKSGMHVQLVVKQGQGSLLTYIPAFQSSFMAEIERFDARVWEWLLSISWQFAGITSTSGGEMPSEGDWKPARPAEVAAARPVEAEDDDVAQDLKALFAIRDAALRQAEADPEDGRPDFEPTRPGAGFPSTGSGPTR